MVKLRLKRCGRKQRAVYRIVAIDVRARREGRDLQTVGFYDPINNQTHLNVPAILDFLEQGAQPTGTVYDILKKAGIFAELQRNRKRRAWTPLHEILLNINRRAWTRIREIVSLAFTENP